MHVGDTLSPSYMYEHAVCFRGHKPTKAVNIFSFC